MNIYELNGIDKEQMEYEAMVVSLVRQRYSQNEENALLRKKLAGLDKDGEFEAYNLYVEECKRRAKEKL